MDLSKNEQLLRPIFEFTNKYKVAQQPTTSSKAFHAMLCEKTGETYKVSVKPYNLYRVYVKGPDGVLYNCPLGRIVPTCFRSNILPKQQQTKKASVGNSKKQKTV